jgi:maltooligosyltrehalose trehalohydrolase
MPDVGVSFRVWAENRTRVAAVIEGGPGFDGEPLSIELDREEGNYFRGVIPQAAEGTLYRFRLDEGPDLYPDPASRYQPDGPHGPSKVIDPTRFPWTDNNWGGVAVEGQVVYEMHIGTFTADGTWEAASHELEELARLGITVIELMPVADFPGRFGWGYDGVDLFAPTRLYGSPDDFRSLVDMAHCAGIAVILDVVYNHLGPYGNYLPAFSDSYLTDRYKIDWGKAINFDGPGSGPVREFFETNARYWIDEFHLDGLRLDATQAITDASPEHIIVSVTRAVRQAAGLRRTIVIAENESQIASMAQPADEGGYGVDALWNDDFHHSARVALTGRREGYYTDYTGSPQEFISMIKRGYLYQGQYYLWQKKCRGVPADHLSPASFVLFIENHDQVANSCCGQRIHQLAAPALVRTMTVLLLLAPGTPMLFMGQEFAASAPFLYFADLPEQLSADIHKGRIDFLSQFPSLTDPCFQTHLPDSGSLSTFLRCKLDLSERKGHHEAYALHGDLLKLRREDPVFRAQERGAVDGAVLGKEAFVLRFFGPAGDDRLLTVNFGADLRLAPVSEPLLAPPKERYWDIILSSEDYRYGGWGTPSMETEAVWRIPGRSAMAFAPRLEGWRAPGHG